MASESPFSTEMEMLRVGIWQPGPRYLQKVVPGSQTPELTTTHDNASNDSRDIGQNRDATPHQSQLLTSPLLAAHSQSSQEQTPQTTSTSKSLDSSRSAYSGSTKRLTRNGRTPLPTLSASTLRTPSVLPPLRPQPVELAPLPSIKQERIHKSSKRRGAQQQVADPTRPEIPSGSSKSTINAQKRAQKFQTGNTEVAGPRCKRCEKKNDACIQLKSAPNTACWQCTKDKAKCDRS